MKKTISILILGILPGVTLAGAGHGGGHGMKSSPEMGQMGHDSHNMSNTTHDNHESAAGQPGEWSNISRTCLLYTSPSPRDMSASRMPSSA